MVVALSRALRRMGFDIPYSAKTPIQRHGKNMSAVATRSFPTIDIPTYVLSDRERDDFTMAVKSISLSPYTHYETLLEPLGRIFRETVSPDLCQELRKTTVEQRRHGFLLKNCPINKNPGPTPDDDGIHPPKGFLEEFFLLGLTHVRDYVPYHDREERHGLPFLPIITLRGHEQELSSRGLGFGWHTEHIHLGDREGIDLIDLLCIKGDPKAATGVFSVEGFMKGLPEWVIEGMQQPIFRMQTGPSWPSLKMEKVQPILERNSQGYFTIRFNHDFKNRLLAINDEASAVLDYLGHHLETVEQMEFSLAPGDCLTVHNRRAAHQRKAFIPSTSYEQRRWVIGLYAKNKL